MIASELALPEDERVDFISVTTPNHTHFEIAHAAVTAGFNVICDKPMTFDLEQAEQLAAAVGGSVPGSVGRDGGPAGGAGRVGRGPGGGR